MTRPCILSVVKYNLAESETEYVVQCSKHVYPEHTVLQLDCTNTLNDQLHENVAAELVPPEGWDLVVEIICPRVEYNNGQVSPSST